MNDFCNDWYLAGSGLFGILFICSELLGASSCKYNGVFSFILSGMRCCGGVLEVEMRIDDGDEAEVRLNWGLVGEPPGRNTVEINSVEEVCVSIIEVE